MDGARTAAATAQSVVCACPFSLSLSLSQCAPIDIVILTASSRPDIVLLLSPLKLKEQIAISWRREQLKVRTKGDEGGCEKGQINGANPPQTPSVTVAVTTRPVSRAKQSMAHFRQTVINGLDGCCTMASTNFFFFFFFFFLGRVDWKFHLRVHPPG